MRVVFHYAASPELKNKLSEQSGAGLDIKVIKPQDHSAFEREITTCDVLWHVLEPIRAEHIRTARNLRLINKIGVGVDTIDLEAAKAAGIAVCNLPGTNSRAVAEHTVGLMLCALRKTSLFDREIRQGLGWTWPAHRQGQLGEIGGRTIGLVGYGSVARILAPILYSLGTRILYTNRSRAIESAVGTYVTLDELLSRSDIVSLHLPLNERTRNLIGERAFSIMKTGAIFINTARGGLVDEKALIGALQSGKLSAAGLDSFDREPIDTENPLLALDNVVATPHIAWLTLETFVRSIDLLVENCRRLIAGQALLHRVI
jgi:phosphoglycerate dehydrogenase-like enzyme